jgi:hypothetical protein
MFRLSSQLESGIGARVGALHALIITRARGVSNDIVESVDQDRFVAAMDEECPLGAKPTTHICHRHRRTRLFRADEWHSRDSNRGRSVRDRVRVSSSISRRRPACEAFSVGPLRTAPPRHPFGDDPRAASEGPISPPSPALVTTLGRYDGAIRAGPRPHAHSDR